MEDALDNREFIARIPFDEVLWLLMQMCQMRGETLVCPTDYGDVQLQLELGGSRDGTFRIWVWHASTKPYRPTVIKNAKILNSRYQPIIESTGEGYSHKSGMVIFDDDQMFKERASCKILYIVYTLAAPGPRTAQS